MYASVVQKVCERNADPANSDMKWLCDMLTINDRIKSAAELSRHVFFENRVSPPPIKCDKELMCYQCNKMQIRMHGVYNMCCVACGERNLQEIFYQHSEPARAIVRGRVFVVIGGRTKIGYQVALRLLRNGARVVITTRNIAHALATYTAEPDAEEWKQNLSIFSLDLNASVAEVQSQLQGVVDGIKSLNKYKSVDGLFNVAAQTIRGIERHTATSEGETNRYGNARFFPDHLPNSWALTLPDVSAEELEEVMRINAMGPFLVVQAFLPLLLASDWERRCVVNTHAREGCFSVAKNSKHPHTNMAKAALHMLSVMINASGIHCFGVDPGWVSVDEYSKSSAPLPAAPLTEIDGATRLLHPLLTPVYKRPHRFHTVRHFDQRKV